MAGGERERIGQIDQGERPAIRIARTRPRDGPLEHLHRQMRCREREERGQSEQLLARGYQRESKADRNTRAAEVREKPLYRKETSG